jgi:hypothetical protein
LIAGQVNGYCFPAFNKLNERQLKLYMMNDLHIDFNEKNHSLKVRQRFFTYLGIIFCVIGLLTVLFGEISLPQIISPSINFILGLIFIIQSNPHIFKWTKCYFDISESEIKYKFWGLQRKTIIKWDEVNALTMDFNEIYFDLESKKTKSLNLSFISDSTNTKIKQSIIGIGNEKGIKILEKN